MREDEPGVVIVFPINHMRTFFETIECLDEMRFCEALFGLDVDCLLYTSDAADE